MEAISNEEFDRFQLKLLEDTRQALGECINAFAWSNNEMPRLTTIELRVISAMTTHLLRFILGLEFDHR
jgi:hypothetical protein